MKQTDFVAKHIDYIEIIKNQTPTIIPFEEGKSFSELLDQCDALFPNKEITKGELRNIIERYDKFIRSVYSQLDD
jgi:hypothetical protein